MYNDVRSTKITNTYEAIVVYFAGKYISLFSCSVSYKFLFFLPLIAKFARRCVVVRIFHHRYEIAFCREHVRRAAWLVVKM